jgi:acylphosphatase
MERLHVIYYGKVQGVWFRANCQRNAIDLGLTGWVRNLPDGTVEAVVEGERGRLEEHLRWCSDNQPYAKVTKVDIDWGPSTGEFSGFSIKR